MTSIEITAGAKISDSAARQAIFALSADLVHSVNNGRGIEIVEIAERGQTARRR